MSTLAPILLRPRLTAFRNRWRTEKKKSSVAFRDLLVLFSSFVVMYGIYRVSLYALQKLESVSQLVYFSPVIPFSILLLLLFCMLLVSNSLTALGALFLSKDLDLILSAPVSRFRFFVGKMASVLFVSSWMPLLFIIPFLLAYGQWYEAGVLFYGFAPIVLIPYFLIPAAIAFLFSLLFTALIPPSKTRFIGVLVIACFVAFIALAAKFVGDGIQARSDVTAVLEIMNTVSLPDTLWLPSRWVAIAFRDAIEGRYLSAWTPVGLLFVVAIGFLSLAYLVFGFFYELAYSRSCDTHQQVVLHAKRVWHFFLRWVPWLSAPRRAILLKEYRVFFRDMPQLVQLLLLAGVYLVYLYNLRIFRLVEDVSAEQQAAWQSFIYVINVSMGAFVTTAASTRLVYPSLSLEGKAYWMIQTSPLSLQRVMMIKFWSWFVPIGLLSSVVFLSGGLAIKLSAFELFITFCTGWLLSTGIVGLGMGLGARFAFFDWEHSAQLAASFGSFVFMLSCIALITANMVPVGFLLFIREPGMMGESMSDLTWGMFASGCALLVIAIDVFVVRWSLRMGAMFLEENR